MPVQAKTWFPSNEEMQKSSKLLLNHCATDMSNSIAVPLVLLFLKVLPLPLIIAYVDLEQLVLQLILVSSNNYWLLEHCYWSLGNWKYCYCNWYWNCTEKRIGIGIAIGIVLHKQLVLVLPLILHSKNNWYWYCNWYCIPQTIDIGIAIDIAFKKQLLLPLPLLMLMMSNHAFFIKFTPWYIDRIHRNLDLQYWYWHHYGSFLRLFKIFESLTHSFATRLYLTCRIHFWRSPNPGCTIKGCSLAI